jgi:hypothetical protein
MKFSKNDMHYDKRYVIDLFVTDTIAEVYQMEKPYDKCVDKDKGCKKGVRTDGTGYCSKCIKPFLLKNILNVPPRYDVEFESPSFKNSIKEENLLNQKFLVLTGSDFYIKLVAFYFAKEYIKQDKIVYFVESKMFQTYKQVADFSEETHIDFLAMRFADVIIFKNTAEKLADMNYKILLQSRMDNNLPIIFLNEPEIISLKDQSGTLFPGIKMYNTEDTEIKIK